MKALCFTEQKYRNAATLHIIRAESRVQQQLLYTTSYGRCEEDFKYLCLKNKSVYMEINY